MSYFHYSTKSVKLARNISHLLYCYTLPLLCIISTFSCFSHGKCVSTDPDYYLPVENNHAEWLTFNGKGECKEIIL